MKNNPECLGGQMPAGRRFFRNLRPAGAHWARCRRAGDSSGISGPPAPGGSDAGGPDTTTTIIVLVLLIIGLWGKG